MAGTVNLSLPYAFRELRETRARYKAYHGGRGGAKSHSFAQALVLMGYERRDFRWLFAREIQKSISASVKRLLEDKIREARLGPVEDGGNGYYNITDRTITGGGGRTEFLFAGLRTNPDSIKSMEGLDGAWVEEANKASRRSLELLIPTVRKPESEIWLSWNRHMASDPVDDMFLGGQPPPNSIVRCVNWRDNPWFPDVLRQEMEWDKRRDRDKWLHIWEGHPVQRSDSKVFSNWRVDDLDDELPADAVPRYGADWGFSTDPTVLVKCYVFGRTLYIREEAYRVRCEIDDTPALFAGDDPLERWENRHGHPGVEGADRYRIVADSARPETISYMRRKGFDIHRAIKGARSVEEGVEFMKSHDIVVHPSCTHVEDELSTYSYKIDKLTDDVLPELADKHNHTVDACRYALEGVRRSSGRDLPIVGPRTVESKL